MGRVAMLAGDDETPRPLVVIVEHRSNLGLLLAMLAGQKVLICAKPDEPPEPDIAKILERIAPPICAEDFEFSEPLPSRSKSKHERRRARGWE